MAFYTYILASRQNGAIYAGSTDGLIARVSQHKAKTFDGFTAQYGVDQLVWFEVHDSRDGAFRRERQIKMEAALEGADDRREQSRLA